MAAMLALAVLGCGADQAGVESDDAWARTSPAAVSVGAAYVELTSAETDRLIGVSVDPSVAASVEIHEIVPVSGHMGDTDSGDTNSGETELGDTESSETEMPHQMQEVTGGLELPAGETVVLEPGGYHLMLIDLVEPLEAGSAFELELDFENSDPLTVTFDVRDQ